MKFRMFTMRADKAKIAIHIDKVVFVREVTHKDGSIVGTDIWLRDTRDGDMIKLEVGEDYLEVVFRLNMITED